MSTREDDGAASFWFTTYGPDAERIHYASRAKTSKELERFLVQSVMQAVQEKESGRRLNLNGETTYGGEWGEEQVTISAVCRECGVHFTRTESTDFKHSRATFTVDLRCTKHRVWDLQNNWNLDAYQSAEPEEPAT